MSDSKDADRRERELSKKRWKDSMLRQEKRRQQRIKNYDETDRYIESVIKQYSGESQEQKKLDVKDNDASSLFAKFNKENVNSYKDEVENRFGRLYNGHPEEQRQGNLQRGLGVNPHQKVERTGKYARSSENSGLPRRVHGSLNPNQDSANKSLAQKQSKNSNSKLASGDFNNFTPGSGGGGKLNRPF